jgi:hypothetical protein
VEDALPMAVAEVMVVEVHLVVVADHPVVEDEDN